MTKKLLQTLLIFTLGILLAVCIVLVFYSFQERLTSDSQIDSPQQENSSENMDSFSKEDRQRVLDSIQDNESTEPTSVEVRSEILTSLDAEPSGTTSASRKDRQNILNELDSADSEN